MVSKARATPRKQASQERSRATVSAILRATARILIREGYDRASTNKIAAKAGVSIGSLYQYFPSKEALVMALASEHAQEMGELLRSEAAALFAEPLPKAIERVVRMMVEAHAIDPQLHKALAEEAPRMRGIEEDMLRFTKTVLEARKSELSCVSPRMSAREQSEALDMAAFILVTLIESLTHAAVIDRQDLLGERFIREVTRLAVGYLTK